MEGRRSCSDLVHREKNIVRGEWYTEWFNARWRIVQVSMVVRFRTATTKAKFYIICHVNLYHDMRFISEIVIYHCMKQVINDSLT